MKKTILISGILTANLVMAGSIFKVFHWPGAGVLITVGLALFALFFLPLALFSNYSSSTAENKNPILHIVTGSVFAIGAMSILFKVMHWPGASILMVAGLLLPFLVFLPVFVYSSRDKKKFSRTQVNAVMFGLTFIAVFSVMLAMQPSKKYLQMQEGAQSTLIKK